MVKSGLHRLRPSQTDSVRQIGHDGPDVQRGSPQWVTVGDRAVTIMFGDRINPSINDRVLAFAQMLRRTPLPGVTDIVPTYHSVTVYYDTLRVRLSSLRRWLQEVLKAERTPRMRSSHLIEVPVLYGDEWGPDLRAVATAAGCSEQDVIAHHSSGEYRVYMLGFLPGFPYMAHVPSPIALPRLPTPRVRVPAGSVAIAGVQTGIYPQEAPGGWRILGRTPLVLFDPARAAPCLIQPRDRVRFVPISRAEFESLVRHGP